MLCFLCLRSLFSVLLSQGFGAAMKKDVKVQKALKEEKCFCDIFIRMCRESKRRKLKNCLKTWQKVRTIPSPKLSTHGEHSWCRVYLWEFYVYEHCRKNSKVIVVRPQAKFMENLQQKSWNEILCVKFSRKEDNFAKKVCRVRRQI